MYTVHMNEYCSCYYRAWNIHKCKMMLTYCVYIGELTKHSELVKGGQWKAYYKETF